MPDINVRRLLQPIPRDAFTAQNLAVTVLRTDLLHPVISGNKWMKLQPWLQQARQEGSAGIMTKGGPWSNHLHATAWACFQENLSFTAVVKATPGISTPMLEDVQKWNGKIIFANHEQFNDENYWENLAFTKDDFYIPMGGEGPIGAAGVSAFFDLLPSAFYDYILCSVGTGTTLVGIAGSTIGYDTLVGCDPGINDPAYEGLIRHMEVTYPGKKFLFSSNPALKKFGKWPDFLPAKMNEWFREWKLPTDIVYTAKMCWQFEEMVNGHFFKPGSQILIVHTGGLQGNRSLPPGLLQF
jgi:1-aminocyclopropane-1-carboxylate deaminase